MCLYILAKTLWPTGPLATDEVGTPDANESPR